MTRCDSCARPLPDKRQRYRLRLELFADPDPPEFGPEDLAADHSAELEALVEAMWAGDIDADEATDEVHEAHEFTLCPDCRTRLHDFLRQRRLPWDQSD